MSSNPVQKQTQKQADTSYEVVELVNSPITNLVVAMQKVKTYTKEAKLNQTSISDGKGGRIQLNEEKDNPKQVVIRGTEDPSNTIKGIE